MRSIWQLGLIIALTRLVTLSIPFVDTIMLSRYGSEQLSIYIIGNQLPQLLIVIAMGLLTGINVMVPKERNDLTQLVASGLFYTSVIAFISVIILLASNSIYSSDKEILIKNLLSVGVPAAIFSYAVASVLESCGYEKLTLIVSILSGMINPVLNYILIYSEIKFFADASYAVAVSTSIIRLLMMLIGLYILFKVTNLKVNKINLCAVNHIKSLLTIGIPESLSRGIFAGSIVFLSFYISRILSMHQIAVFGIALSIISTFLVFFVGIVISLTVNLSRMRKDTALDIKSALILAIKSIIPIFLLFILFMTFSRNFLAYLYVDNNQLLYSDIVTVIPFCIAVIVLDAAASSMVSLLRVYGDEKVPPLLKMMAFICLGIPIALLYLEDHAIVGVLAGFIIGNSLAVILLAIRFQILSSKLRYEYFSRKPQFDVSY